MRRPIFALSSVIVVIVINTSLARAAEICGDGLDNDNDSLADEGCFCSARHQCGRLMG